MACDIAAFRAAFPELDFASTPNAAAAQKAASAALITVKLAESVATVDRTVYVTDAVADQATLYLAAHLLVSSPSGMYVALRANEGYDASLYGKRYDELVRAYCCGGLVA